MTIQHHPDLAWLLDHATQALGRGFDTVVAGHLLHCDACRTALAQVERLGAALVEQSPVLRPSLTAAEIRARAATATSDATPARLPSGGRARDLRGFAAAALGFDWGSLDWRAGTRGLRIARLANDADEHIWLLHGEPGTALPEHRHSGAELTLILHGAYVSHAEEYAAGDVDENDVGGTHKMVVTAASDCVSLLVFEGQLTYTGAFGLLQKLLRF